ncbi:positive transcriptional regulator for purine utilization [Fusarium acutatum]|uniref:Positive transcriptional regulator for purine utilization n=1 Tax=Fusarium acutatum TaxID=78861 RepID=A0A8H4JV44_9HYPO|nr:positive transcriptional regulator for purine utilization [Fusarium acutatum]
MTDTPSNRKRSSVRRANVTACQRCKSRKQRCDQTIPACSSCARAVVPYIKNLEDRVVELELALRNQGIDTESVVSRASQDALESTPGACSSNDLNLLRLLVPRPNDIQHPEDSAYHTLLDTITVPDTIKFPPRPTTIQLTATYFEHSNFFSPVLNQKSFHDTIAILYQDQTSPDQGTSV